MKISTVMWAGLLLVSLSTTACSLDPEDGAGSASLDPDQVSEFSEVLSKAEEELVASGQSEQDDADLEAPQDTL